MCLFFGAMHLRLIIAFRLSLFLSPFVCTIHKIAGYCTVDLADIACLKCIIDNMRSSEIFLRLVTHCIVFVFGAAARHTKHKTPAEMAVLISLPVFCRHSRLFVYKPHQGIFLFIRCQV